MLWIGLLLLLAVQGASAIATPCDPARELCRVVPGTDVLVPAGAPDGTPDAARPKPGRIDACGVDGGDGTSCLGCDGRPYPHGGAPVLDACGRCGGDGTSCCGGGRCGGNGACSRGVCHCRAGWGGPTCEEVSLRCDGVDCGPRGTCDADTGACACEDGWLGSRCQMRNCLPHGAYDRATDSCRCAPGWGGPDCRECAAAGDAVWVCRGEDRLLGAPAAYAGLLLEQGRAWRPGTAVGGLRYACDCTAVPDVPEPDAEARALTADQLEDAFNELSVVAIDRLTADQSDLDAAVAASDAAAESTTRLHAVGIITAYAVQVGAVVAIGIAVAYVIPSVRAPGTVL